MKWILAALCVFSLSAHASYYEENCANADGTARWMEGHNDNHAHFRLINDQGEWQSAEFYTGDLKVTLKSKRTIKKEESGGECWAGEDHWFSATATVEPSEEVAEKFKEFFGKSSFTDYVICHYQYSGDTGGEGCDN